jgi:hypothetical protein
MAEFFTVRMLGLPDVLALLLADKRETVFFNDLLYRYVRADDC